MAEFKVFTEGVEVSGEAIFSFVHGLEAFHPDALGILARHGIVDPQPGQWFSQQAFFNAFREIADQIGVNALFSVGQHVPDNARWVEGIQSIERGLISIDIAYHLNHRLRGQVLYDEQTETMFEGIGHYRAERIDHNHLWVICENPYPCAFDKGLVSAVAERYKSRSTQIVTVAHDMEHECRTRGDDSCRFIIVEE